MGKNYMENSLKRFLKRKVRITLGVVIGFLISGAVVYTAENDINPNIEGTVEWYKWEAQKALKGTIYEREDGITENTLTEIKEKNGLTVTNSTENGKATENKITIGNILGDESAVSGTSQTYLKEITISSDILSNDGKKVVDEALAKSGAILNSDLNKSSYTSGENQVVVLEGEVIENNGVIKNSTGDGQTVSEKNGRAYNYGIIDNGGTNGQRITKENGKVYNYGVLIGQRGQIVSGTGINGEIYNYGIIAGKTSYGQLGAGINSKVYNYGIIMNKLTEGQTISGSNAEIYNYGIIANGTSSGQSLSGENQKGYNYGIVQNSGDYGQTISGSNTEIYNYGIIANTGNFGQQTNGILNKVYNYGIIENKNNYGQYINSTTNQAGNNMGYNYGIIENKNNNGQYVNSASGATGSAYNYGIIQNSGTNGQYLNRAGSIYNYGLISNTGNYGMGVTNGGTGIEQTAINYGVVKNGTGNIFNGSVDNKGIVIATAQDTSNLNMGSGTNTGVVLNNSYGLIEGQNTHVTTDMNTFLGEGSGVKTGNSNSETPTYTALYLKNTTASITGDLTGKVLTTVVNDSSDMGGSTVPANEGGDTSSAVFSYSDSGAAESKELVLDNTIIIGYFEKEGTLLSVDSNLVLANGTKINAVKSDLELDVTTLEIGVGKTLTMFGDSEVIGKIAGEGKIASVASQTKDLETSVSEIYLKNANSDEQSYLGDTSKNYTDISYKTMNADTIIMAFTDTTEGQTNIVALGENSIVGQGTTDMDAVVIDGTGSTDSINLEIANIGNIYGSIKLGSGDDKLTVSSNKKYDGTIDLGAGENTFEVNLGTAGTTKSEGNTFDYKVLNAENINLTGGNWFIGENADIGFASTSPIARASVDNTLNLGVTNGMLYVELNNNKGTGETGTSLDNIAEQINLTVTSENGGIKYIVGDNFNVNKDVYNVGSNYNISNDTQVTGASIFDTQKQDDGSVKVRVLSAHELGLGGYESMYGGLLGGLSEDENLRNAINYNDVGYLRSMVYEIDNTASAYYTTGYAVTKNIIDSYMGVIDSFGKKANRGEWLAQAKYINSDTEFDGGKNTKGYDGEINGAVGMLEYGVSDTTSYGAVFGGGKAKIDIKGGGKLEGDNFYFGGYIKHSTENGIDLLGNIGYATSELETKIKSSFTLNGHTYNPLADGNADSSAITVALKGKKDFYLTDTVKVQPSVGFRYSLIKQDAVKGQDMNFRIDEQDINLFEVSVGADIVKDIALEKGKLSLNTGAEYVLSNTSRSNDARYRLYNDEVKMVNEEDISNNKIKLHVGADYEHENGVGFDVKYEAILTDKGNDKRIIVGASYRF